MMRRSLGNLLSIGLLLIGGGCSSLQTHGAAPYSGGDATVFNNTSLAFQQQVPGLTAEQSKDFALGHRIFKARWVKAPSSTSKFDGLGPTYNRYSCSACHILDGRGKPPDQEGAPMESMLVRLSIPGTGPHGGVKPHPDYGDQLKDRAIEGVLPEGRAIIHYHEIVGHYPDGQEYSLRVPQYEFVDLNFGPFGDDILFSPRVAPFMFGFGLLESVPEEMIFSIARAQKNGPDGVSGKPNYVWDIEKQKMVLGRLGWKANQPGVRQQIADAFMEDIGITNPVFPKEDIPDVQTAAKAVAHYRTPEINEDLFRRLEFYVRTLAVPARRNLNDPDVIEGEKTFKRIGCAVCHVDTLRTGENKEIKELSYQTIHPYTDLLLHDMGDDLADGRPDFQASGREWRTPPLWGIGLVKTVNEHTFFLHDGRARSLEEAILWHGGQAEAAQKRFKSLSKKERQEILSFLNSL